MLQLLNIITFICTYLGAKVGGEKLWGLRHESPEIAVGRQGKADQLSLGKSTSITNPPTVADGWGTLLLALLVVPISYPMEKER